MILVDDFFNKVVKELDVTYFPQVVYYHDNKHTQRIHYACELFSNGCISLTSFIGKLVKETKDKAENIINLISKYICNYDSVIHFKTNTRGV